MGSIFGKHQLVPHPDTPPKTVASVSVQVPRGRGPLWFEYFVSPTGNLLLPEMSRSERTDGLWKSTCFELFVRPRGSDTYLEFNFSPSSRWAAYEFSGYRAGMRDWPSDDPEIWITPGEHFILTVEAMPDLPPAALEIGFSAVIEERDGTKSYWALRHPPGKPDFHHPDCFALELPAPDGP